MKKTLAVLLAALMVLTLAACTKKNEPKPADSAATAAPEPTEAPAATAAPEPTAAPAATEAPVATEEPAKPELGELLIGSWDLSGVEGEGEAAEQAKSVLSLVEATYTFREDGTVTVTATAFGQTSEESSTYSLDGDKLTVAGDTGAIEISGDTLKMHLNEGYTVVYKRK